MYKYKRGVNKIDIFKQMEYTLSDNLNTCLSLSATLESKKPYNGMYIKNGKIMLSNLIETIEVKDKIYKVVELCTTVQNISAQEYITSIDLLSNTFNYECGRVNYTKKLAFQPHSERLILQYDIENNEDSKVTFKIIPMVTYRDLFSMKTSALLKFSQRKEENGTVLSLSVTNQDNLILKTKDMEWTQESRNLTNVVHEFIDTDLVKQIFIEDLVLPGEFETVIKPKAKKTIRLYISCQNFVINDLENNDIFQDDIKQKQEISNSIEDEYVELKEIAMSIKNLSIDRCLVPSIPYRKDYTLIYYNIAKAENSKNMIKDIQDFTDIIKSIDGQYLTFNNIVEAKKVLIKIRRYIKTIQDLDIQDIDVLKEFILLKLWYIESVNRVLQKDNDTYLYFDFVKEILLSVLNSPKYDEIFTYIEIVSLTYNAIKIYENMLVVKGQEDFKIYEVEKQLKDVIETKFWIEDKKIMKRCLNDTIHVANVEMLYTLSLSYTCITDDIPIKLLDTIFKELYTPYGLRQISKTCPQNTGLIYPKYMAHFVKANLRQNGVTRASQKISYNLVKELIQDINKYVNGGIKKIYHEKGLNIDSIGYDLLTNAEVIRLYNMLT
ncbi:MAG: glycogen debranching enzyme N-terminal domain-containing protein [Clostridia bacterium]